MNLNHYFSSIFNVFYVINQKIASPVFYKGIQQICTIKNVQMRGIMQFCIKWVGGGVQPFIFVNHSYYSLLLKSTKFNIYLKSS